MDIHEEQPRLFEPPAFVAALTIELRPASGWWLFVSEYDAMGRIANGPRHAYGPLSGSELLDVVNATLDRSIAT